MQHEQPPLHQKEDHLRKQSQVVVEAKQLTKAHVEDPLLKPAFIQPHQITPLQMPKGKKIGLMTFQLFFGTEAYNHSLTPIMLRWKDLITWKKWKVQRYLRNPEQSRIFVFLFRLSA
jgi:hypothetical protein